MIMGSGYYEELSISIGNAIRSLYQLILLVEEDTQACYIMDYNKEIHNLGVDKAKSFDLICKKIYKNVHPKDRESFSILADVNRIHDELSHNVCISADCRIRHADSRYYWTKITICNAKVENSAQGKEYLFLLEDIHQQKSGEKAEINELLSTITRLEGEYADLFSENMTDQQTGCYNRKGFVYFENQIINEAKRDKRAVFICVLDLNGLKHINDTYGHKYGDEAIRAVAEALKQASPKDSKIIRTCGDEILILAVVDSNEDQSAEFSAGVQKALEEYNSMHHNKFLVNASYGIVITDDLEEINNLDKFIEIADQKMYEMKEKTDPYKR